MCCWLPLNNNLSWKIVVCRWLRRCRLGRTVFFPEHHLYFASHTKELTGEIWWVAIADPTSSSSETEDRVGSDEKQLTHDCACPPMKAPCRIPRKSPITHPKTLALVDYTHSKIFSMIFCIKQNHKSSSKPHGFGSPSSWFKGSPSFSLCYVLMLQKIKYIRLIIETFFVNQALYRVVTLLMWCSHVFPQYERSVGLLHYSVKVQETFTI